MVVRQLHLSRFRHRWLRLGTTVGSHFRCHPYVILDMKVRISEGKARSGGCCRCCCARGPRNRALCCGCGVLRTVSAWHNRWRDPNRTRDDNQYHDGRRCMTTLTCAACNALTRHALLRDFRHDGLDRMTGSAISRRRVCTSSRTAVLQYTADLLLPIGPPPNPQRWRTEVLSPGGLVGALASIRAYGKAKKPDKAKNAGNAKDAGDPSAGGATPPVALASTARFWPQSSLSTWDFRSCAARRGGGNRVAKGESSASRNAQRAAKPGVNGVSVVSLRRADPKVCKPHCGEVQSRCLNTDRTHEKGSTNFGGTEVKFPFPVCKDHV